VRQCLNAEDEHLRGRRALRREHVLQHGARSRGQHQRTRHEVLQRKLVDAALLRGHVRSLSSDAVEDSVWQQQRSVVLRLL
jgi:hypothetical protein